jgi:hypothetical protein
MNECFNFYQFFLSFLLKRRLKFLLIKRQKKIRVKENEFR